MIINKKDESNDVVLIKDGKSDTVEVIDVVSEEELSEIKNEQEDEMKQSNEINDYYVRKRKSSFDSDDHDIPEKIHAGISSSMVIFF